jgi:hypothetical protein
MLALLCLENGLTYRGHIPTIFLTFAGSRARSDFLEREFKGAALRRTAKRGLLLWLYTSKAKRSALPG